MPDVAAHEANTALQSRAPYTLPRPRQHCIRSIDANDVRASASEWKRNATRAAAKFQHAPTGIHREIAPERHVATAECSRVLPVVERRVVVPAFPAFGDL